MLNPSFIVARKEIVDHWRDRRSVASALLYTFMGPIAVSFVSFSLPKGAPEGSPLPGLMSVFALVAAFTGGMGLAMDTLAGERERRSLLPLLLNPISRRDVIAGKWLAVAAFTAAGLLLNLVGFAGTWVMARMPMPVNQTYLLLTLGAGLLPLTLLSSAIELLISASCRSVKEAQTYLSMVVFIPMLLGMGLVFFPGAIPGWLRLVPVAGQQLQLMLSMRGGAAHFLQPLTLGWITLALSVLAVMAAARRLQRDDIACGN